MSRQSNLKKSRKIAVAAVLSALGTLILYLGGVVEILDMTCAAFASLIVVFAYLELKGAYPFLIYAVTSVISVLILPNKFPALIYIAFAGYYPIFKAAFERLHYIIGWICKLSLFNTALAIIILANVYLLHMPDTDMGFTPFVFGAGNLLFILYDLAFTKLITLYLVKIRSMLKLKNYFED